MLLLWIVKMSDSILMKFLQCMNLSELLNIVANCSIFSSCKIKRNFVFCLSLPCFKLMIFKQNTYFHTHRKLLCEVELPISIKVSMFFLVLKNSKANVRQILSFILVWCFAFRYMWIFFFYFCLGISTAFLLI